MHRGCFFSYFLGEEICFVEKRLASFDFIISHCGEGVLLRGGRTEMLKRRTSVSSGSRWSSVDMIHFIIAHLNRLVARGCIKRSSGA